MRNYEWSGHVMKLTPIKKIIIGLAAMCIVVTLITANNLTSVMMLMAAQNAKANVQNNNAVVQQQGTVAPGNTSSGTVSGNTSTGSNSGNTITGNTGNTGNSSNAGTSNSGASNGGASNDSTVADKKPAGDAGANATTADGLKMYVDALNKAKSSAKTVVKTKTSASHYKEHLVIDGNAIIKATLEPIGKSLMGTFMKASEPNETIDKNDLPPKGIQCTLTEADLQEAPKVEKSGDNTVVTLVLKGASDPKAGSGLGSAVSIIEEKTITDAVAGAIDISNIHLDYDACTIIATIDASGNLVALSVNAPCILKLTAMGVNAEVGIECYDEFTIAY